MEKNSDRQLKPEDQPAQPDQLAEDLGFLLAKEWLRQNAEPVANRPGKVARGPCKKSSPPK
jgi:hypothetical protein